MPVPQVRVEIAFPSSPDDPAQEWVNVTEYVRAEQGVSCSRGRSDEFATVEPGTLTLTLSNEDGRFTFGNTESPYYPNVVPMKRIRLVVSADGITWRQRFDGYINTWPTSWLDESANEVRMTISATDRLGRFGSRRLLRHPLAEEFGASAAQTGSRVA